jgi:hypothetical protein
VKKFLLSLILLSSGLLFSQVGINTTTPSPASVLDVNSSSDGTNFGGFMLPRVTVAQRDLIPATEEDAGLAVYVIDGANSQMQVWNGTTWRSLFPNSIEVSTIICAWDVNGLTAYGPSPYAATITGNGVTIGGLTRGSGLTTTGMAAGSTWGATGWYEGSTPDMPNDAIAANTFVTFSITPSFGVEISLSVIEPYNIRRSGTGPTTGIWQYSINGGAYIDIGSPITWGPVTTPAAAGNLQSAINLTEISPLQNLTSDSTVTFRIVNWGASGNTGTWYINDISGNDLIIRGKIIQ